MDNRNKNLSDKIVIVKDNQPNSQKTIPDLPLENAIYIVEQSNLVTACHLMQTNSFWYNAGSMSNWKNKLLKISSINAPPEKCKSILNEIYRLKKTCFRSNEEAFSLFLSKNEMLNIEYAELLIHTYCLQEHFRCFIQNNNPYYTPCAPVLDILYSARRITLAMEQASGDTITFSFEKLEGELKKYCPPYLKNQILSIAVQYQLIDLAYKSLKAGANPNTFSFDYRLHRNMLHIAASQGNDRMMKLLMKYKACPIYTDYLPEAESMFPDQPINLLNNLQYHKMQYAEDSIERSNFIACEQLVKDVDWSTCNYPYDQIMKEAFPDDKYREFVAQYYHRDKQITEKPTMNYSL